MKFNTAALLLAVGAGVVPLPVALAKPKYFYDDQDNWENLDFSPSPNQCGNMPTATSGQSPINFASADCNPSLPGIIFHPGDCGLHDLEFQQRDNGIAANYKDTCTRPTMMLPERPGEVFTAANVHFHIGSEHRIDDEVSDAEMHVVHLNEDGSAAAVLGFKVDNDGEHNPLFDGLLACFTETMNNFIATCNDDLCTTSRRRKLFLPDSECPAEKFNVYEFIPDGSGYYFYDGSLTTPPCFEIVEWNLLDTKVKISLAQWRILAHLTLKYAGYIDEDGKCILEETVASETGSTSRLPQPIGDRKIFHKCSVVAH